MTDKDPLVWIHEQDQVDASIQTVAKTLGVYYRELIAQQFSRDEAFRLAHQMAALLWEKALFHAEGQA